jgi:plasmid stabilization system protein ParE
MPQLIWSPQALLDVQRLYRFLAPKNQDAAKRAVTAIRQGVKVLSLQPGMGRPVEEMNDEFRDWITDFGDSGYVARYRMDAENVIILAVRHQKEAGF